MDSGDFASFRFMTSSIDRLYRRLPYEFRCDCGNVFTIASERDFDFACECGITHHLRDEQDADLFVRRAHPQGT
jgi:hypothetical protein